MMKIKRKWKWISSFVLLILIIGILYLIFGQSKILISYQTTRITEPVDENGYVNYLKHVNQQASKGVTPKNNFEYIARILFGTDQINEDHREEYLNRLGLDESDIFHKENRYRGIYEFLVKKFQEDKKKNLNDVETSNQAEKIMSMIKQPWNDKDFPLVSQWLKANTDKLDLISEATKRPRCYTPYIHGADPVNKVNSLTDVLLYAAHDRRLFARGLSARAMHRISENNIEGAQNDLLAIHRMGGLLIDDSVFSIEMLIGIACDSIACQSDLVMLEKSNMNKDQIMNYLDILKSFQRKSNIARFLDISCRFSFLDELQSFSKEPKQKYNLGKRLLLKIVRSRIDFNSIMEWGNNEFDQLVAAAELNDPIEIIKQAEAQSDKNDALTKKNEPNVISQLFVVLGAAAGQLRGTNQSKYHYYQSMIPAIPQLVEAEYGSNFKADATKIAFALKAYQLDHKKYPEKLGELKPDYLKEIPLDPFTGKLPAYQITEKGFLIYSLGVNQKDEKGYGPRGLTNENKTGDDITVEFPVNPDKYK